MRKQQQRHRLVAVTAVAALAMTALAACEDAEADPTSSPDATTVQPSSDPTSGDGDPSDSSGPSDPTPSSTTEGGSEDPSDGDPPSVETTLPDISDAVIPGCGDVYTPPERESELVIETGPAGPVGRSGGGWDAHLTNTSDDLVQGYLSFDDVIILDDDGRVVAAPDPQFQGAEGPTWLSVVAGESITMPMDIPVACDGGDWLPSGDYESYGAVTFVDDDDHLEQAQGGPWPLTIGDDDDPRSTLAVPDGGAQAVIDCGEPWSDPEPSTGLEIAMIDPIRTVRASSDDIDGRAVVFGETSLRTSVFAEVVVLQDGVVVNLQQGSDYTTRAITSAGGAVPISVVDSLIDCRQSQSADVPLPRGEYQVIVLVATPTSGDGVTVLALTEPVTVSLS